MSNDIDYTKAASASRDFIKLAFGIITDHETRKQLILDHDQAQRDKIAELEKTIQQLKGELHNIEEALLLADVPIDADTAVQKIHHLISMNHEYRMNAWERAEMMDAEDSIDRTDAFDDKDW